jgi:hypothetical protein
VLSRFRESDLFHQCRRNFYQTQTFISLSFAFTMPLATSASVQIIDQKKTSTAHVKQLWSWKKFNGFKMEGRLHLVVLCLITLSLLVLMKVLKLLRGYFSIRIEIVTSKHHSLFIVIQATCVDLTRWSSSGLFRTSHQVLCTYWDPNYTLHLA